MKKNVLLLFVLMLLPMVASADDSGKCGVNVTYTYLEESHTLIISGNGKMKDYGSLDEDRHWVRERTPWNKYKEEIEEVQILSGVTSVGAEAFCGCTALSSVSIPEGVISIGKSAFQSCSSLVSINFPNSLITIEGIAFHGNYNLTTIKLGENVTSIGSQAFQSCSKLTSLYVPKKLEKIGARAFAGCTALSSVYIEDISAWCQIDFKKNSYESDYSSNPLWNGACLYLNNEVITDLVIPEGVTSISASAFCQSKELKSVTIPMSMKKIGKWAFYGCDNISNVYISDISSWCQIDFETPFSNGQLYINNQAITDLVIPEGVTSISSLAFWMRTHLTSISIPNTVSTIGYGAFYGCKGLTHVKIPNSVLSIGNSVFADCGIESVEIGKGLKEISARAFCNCWRLSSVNIPDNIITICDSAFYISSSYNYYNYKRKIYIGRGVTSIGSKVFQYPIEEFYCCADIIPEVKEDTFWSWYIAKTTLYVPAKLLAAYKSKTPWSNFKTIIPITSKYNITYIVDDEEYKTYEIEEGASITPEPAPTKKGYTFSGWSEIPETMPAHDVTVTGTFSINKYKLTYKVDGETYKEYDVEYGATITAEDAPTKEGYTFSGWSEIPETMPAHDVTVTGTFTINKYKLTYKVDGEVYKSYDVEYGASITPEPAPTKEGYTFSGWSEIPETMPAHDVTVTGTFTINKYKLTYIVDGEEYKSYEVEYGAIITPETEPTKEGYTFSGWSKIPETMPAHDVTVTGSFSINSYKLTYMIDNEVYKEVSYEYGATITPEPQPEGDYQTFEWTDLPQTMPAHDVVVHANYTTGIVEIKMTQGDVHIYSPDGKPRNELQKGLNIVRMSDGTVKKIIVK